MHVGNSFTARLPLTRTCVGEADKIRRDQSWLAITQQTAGCNPANAPTSATPFGFILSFRAVLACAHCPRATSNGDISHSPQVVGVVVWVEACPEESQATPQTRKRRSG